MSGATLTVSREPVSTVDIRQRQAATERFIEQSGDGQAIRALGPLRRSPEGWLDQLKSAATSQTTLKIALGVFLGVVAAEAALAALRSDTVAALLGEIEAALQSAAGNAPAAAVESGAFEAADPLSGSDNAFENTPPVEAADAASASSFLEDAISPVVDALESTVEDVLDMDLGSILDDLLD